MRKFEQVLVSVKADMLCLQEIKCKWSELIFCSCGCEKTCVAILIKNDVVKNVKQVYADKSGQTHCN